MNFSAIIDRVSKEVSSHVSRFEIRFILAAGITGFLEILLGVSPLGFWLGHYLQTFGYLGTGLILMAVSHYVLMRIDCLRRNT